MRWDVIVPLLLYLVLMLVIGYWSYLKTRSAQHHQAEEYYLGGRSLGGLVLVFTLLASLASAGTFIGGPGLGYRFGFSWVLLALCQVPSALLTLGILGKKFAIVARKINAITVTDFLKERYRSDAVVIASSVAILLFMGAYMVAQFIGGARVFESLTGLPYTWSLIFFGGCVVLYTAFGGFRAVAYTDLIQGLIMAVGGILLWIFVLAWAGGLGSLARRLAELKPEVLTLPGPENFGSLQAFFSYWILLGVGIIALPHSTVRAMAYKDARAMHRAIMAGSAVMAIFTLGFITMGVFARAYHQHEVEVGDLALPMMILDIMPGPVAGVLLAAALAAVMSTVDSMLLVLSGAIVKDLYKNYVSRGASDQALARIASFATFALGALSMLMAFAPPSYLEFLVLYSIGGLEAAFFWPIVLGLYWRRANGPGAFCAMATGITSYILLSRYAGSPLGFHPVAVSWLMALLVQVVVTYVTPPPPRDVLIKFWGTLEEVRKLQDSSVVRGVLGGTN